MLLDQCDDGNAVRARYECTLPLPGRSMHRVQVHTLLCNTCLRTVCVCAEFSSNLSAHLVYRWCNIDLRQKYISATSKCKAGNLFSFLQLQFAFGTYDSVVLSLDLRVIFHLDIKDPSHDEPTDPSGFVPPFLYCMHMPGSWSRSWA